MTTLHVATDGDDSKDGSASSPLRTISRAADLARPGDTLSRLGEEERGPSLLDQRHRAVITFTYQLPYNMTAGTVTQLASARPFNAITGIDNNGDGANNDRPVVNGAVISKSAFRGSPTSDVSAFIEGPVRLSGGLSVLLRLEGFNLFNHGNYLGRGQTVYGNTDTPSPTFGQLVAVGTATSAIPAFANVDPPRMFQLQARVIFECTKPITTNDDLKSWWRTMLIGLDYLVTRGGPMGVGINQGGIFARVDPGAATPDVQFHVATLSSDMAGSPTHPFSGFTLSVCQLRPGSRGFVRIVSNDPLAPPDPVATFDPVPAYLEDLAKKVSASSVGRGKPGSSS